MVFFDGEAQAIDFQPQRAERGCRRQGLPQLRQRRIRPRGDEGGQQLLLACQDP